MAGATHWPVERSIQQRYNDVAPATLIVPTMESFVGRKTAAWHDRSAPRDLYDLWALAERGALTSTAAAVFAKHGPTAGQPRDFMFRRTPTESQWESALAGQTRLEVSAAEALLIVRRTWALPLGEDWD